MSKLDEARRHLKAARIAIDEHLHALGVKGVDILSHPLGIAHRLTADAWSITREFQFEETFRLVNALDVAKTEHWRFEIDHDEGGKK